MSSLQPRTIVGVIPTGVSMTQALSVMRSLDACNPPDSLSMRNGPSGELCVVYDPEGARKSTDSGSTTEDSGDYALSVGHADPETFTARDVDLVTFALRATEENETASFEAIAQWMKNMMGRYEAANYLALSLGHKGGEGRYALTLQKVGALTPAEKIDALEGQVTDLRQRLADADNDLDDGINRDT